MAEQNSLVFEIRACSDALIQLPEFHGINDYHSYELHLGLFQIIAVSLSLAYDGNPIKSYLLPYMHVYEPTCMYMYYRISRHIGVHDGENQNMEIRKVGTSERAQKQMTTPMDCDHSNQYWVMWQRAVSISIYM